MWDVLCVSVCSYTCVCVHVLAHMHACRGMSVVDKLGESVLSFYHVGHRIEFRVLGLAASTSTC